MDQSTHDVRRTNWLNIVNQCQERPANVSVRQWLADNDIKEIAVMEAMLSCVEQIGDFRKTPLYEHMDFKEIREDFMAELKENLLKCFRDEENFGFLKNDERWKKIVKQ